MLERLRWEPAVCCPDEAGVTAHCCKWNKNVVDGGEKYVCCYENVILKLYSASYSTCNKLCD